MGGFQKGKVKNRTQNERLLRLERVSSMNYFAIKKQEELLKAIADRLGLDVEEGQSTKEQIDDLLGKEESDV